MMFLFAGHSDKPLKSLISMAHKGNHICLYRFSFILLYDCLVRGHLYMPNQRYESHHKICNLRYGTLAMGGMPDGFHRLKSLHAAQSWINKKQN